MKLITATDQRNIELAASKLGLDVKKMIARAGKAAFDAIKRNSGVTDRTVAVLCGRGGNGADGFVIAEHMKNAGAQPTIVLCGGTPPAEAPQAAYMQALLAGVPVLELETEYDQIVSLLQTADVVVDAVFGLGFKGELPRPIANMFAVVNQTGAQVVAMDVPSGIDADSGVAAENTIKANKTLYVVGKKPAHILKSSSAYCGALEYLDIGIPAEAYDSIRAVTCVLEPTLAADILPAREETGHKWTFGSVVCAAGSERYRGAAVLCAKGALASGAGLVSVASVEPVLAAVAAQCPEAILLDIQTDAAGIESAFAKASAFVVGCGLKADVAMTMLRHIFKDAHCPVVVDAEGINAVAANIDIVKETAAPVILTPHIGEFARLLNADPDTVYHNRIRFAREFALLQRVVVVLKSDNTLVACPNGTVYVNTAGNAGLAKGGSGDLLSGVIGSLCAMGIPAEQAAMLGVYMHALACDIAVRYVPKHAVTPSIVARYLAEAISEIAEMAEQGRSE